jgi:hypothetical protein
LKIYDVKGREIGALINEEEHAGSYQVNFNAEGLASGFYFYKIEASDFVHVKKMIFLH